MSIKIFFMSIILLAFSPLAYAQRSDTYNMWFQYLLSAKLTDKSTLTALSQYRSFDLAYDTRLFLVSAYVDYEVADDVRPALGAMFLTLNSYKADGGKRTRYEKRPFQQVSLGGNIGRTSVSHRFRVEERFINNPNEFVLRLRYLISLRIPFNKAGQPEQYYGILKNEIRMNAKKDEPFDSNRLTAGFGRKLGKNAAVEIAWINQVETGRPSNYAYVGYRSNFDWRKNK